MCFLSRRHLASEVGRLSYVINFSWSMSNISHTTARSNSIVYFKLIAISTGRNKTIRRGKLTMVRKDRSIDRVELKNRLECTENSDTEVNNTTYIVLDHDPRARCAASLNEDGLGVYYSSGYNKDGEIVTSCTSSSNGCVLVTAHRRGVVRLWDGEAGRPHFLRKVVNVAKGEPRMNAPIHMSLFSTADNFDVTIVTQRDCLRVWSLNVDEPDLRTTKTKQTLRQTLTRPSMTYPVRSFLIRHTILCHERSQCGKPTRSSDNKPGLIRVHQLPIIVWKRITRYLPIREFPH